MIPAYDQDRIGALLDLMDNGASFDARGTALEDLMVYLFDCVPGVAKQERDAVNRKKTRELDIVFWNNRSAGWLDFLEWTIIVECKNWSDPLGSKEVYSFGDTLRRTHQHYGILVAASGITGDPDDLNAAHGALSEIFGREGICVLVLTRAEIEKLTCPEELRRILQKKICQLAARGTSIPG